MKSSLNLIPSACLDIRTRAHRQLAWSIAVTICGALVFAGWISVSRSRDNYDRFDGQFAILQAQQTDFDLKLTRASRERVELFNRARQVMWLRPPNRVPEQLAALAKLTPEGVILSDLRATPFVLAKPVVAAASQPAGPEVVANSAGQQTAPTPRRGTRQIQIGGWAASFADVQKFREAITAVPNWEKVEPGKSTREMKGDRELVRFQIECVDREGGP